MIASVTRTFQNHRAKQAPKSEIGKMKGACSLPRPEIPEVPINRTPFDLEERILMYQFDKATTGHIQFIENLEEILDAKDKLKMVRNGEA